MLYEVITAKCKNAFEAANVLQTNEVNILFLDINMPKLNGLNFLKTLRNPPAVIITTAYREYALDAFEMDVVDYLKKPFAFERFYKAINKAISQLSLSQKIVEASPVMHPDEPPRNLIFVKEDKITYKVDIEMILFIESVGDYNKIHTRQKVYLTYQTLKKLQDLLPFTSFPRIHKSYIVALSKIDSIIGNP